MHLTILPGATGGIQKKLKNATFLKMRKNLTKAKFQLFGDFQVRQTSQFYKNYSQAFFFKVDFCIFNPHNFEVKENCSKHC